MRCARSILVPVMLAAMPTGCHNSREGVGPPTMTGRSLGCLSDGERVPDLDPEAGIARVSVAASPRWQHLVRAIVEGVALCLRDTFSVFEQLKVSATDIRLGKGGTSSGLGRPIQAGAY